jgi:environmental stress-induced protein Ves
MSDLRTQHLPAADRVDVPWRNGAGRSTEVIVRPGGAGDGFDWRVTIAAVTADTAFSRYPGVDRWLMPISPEGLDLVDDGRLVQLGQVAVHAFAGENEVASTNVTGPTLDLNLMVRRGPGTGSLRSVEVSGRWVAEAAAGEEVVVVVVDGSLRAGSLRLKPRDALLIGNGGRATLQGVGRIAVARVAAGTDHPWPATVAGPPAPARVTF